MKVVSTAEEMAAVRVGVLVPTMGALHAGHVRLTEVGREMRRGPVCVSIFVNPTQFDDPADLARYPQTLDADVAVCERAGVDVVFAPGVQTVYPPGRALGVPPLPRVATEPGLEDAHRPGHFAGVCQVVKRLFELVRARVAVFGEKDWQQLQVVRAMTQELSLNVEIVAVETVREHDGLAMSSRNVFLSAASRERAAGIFAALRVAAEAGARAEKVLRKELRARGVEVEYAVVRDAETLMPGGSGEKRALVAARVGGVRLIDNLGVG